MVRSQKRYPRTARLNESVLEVLADELERMNDPRLELVTFTGVDVSRDLSHAKVYYSTLGATTASANQDFAQDAADALAAAAPHLRSVLGRQMRIRQVPRLDFEVDRGIIMGERIDEILRQIHHGEGGSDQADGAGGGGSEPL